MMTGTPLPHPFRPWLLERVDSTNDEARRLAQNGAAADFLVVAAPQQSHGRGRRGRVWDSPPGNLHCSVLLALTGPLAEAAQLGFAAAVALAEALADLVPGTDFRCKWPNDVLADGRKIAGMLLESGEPGWLVLGLGVDVVACPPPGTALYQATCLAHLGYGGDWSQVLEAFCRRFGPWVDRWRAEGFAPVRQAWLERARGLDEPVVVRLDAETFSGVFAGLDGDGALLLQQPEGNRRILAGDVFFPNL